MSYEQESQRLTEAAARVLPEAAGAYLERIRDALLPEGREFAAYLRGKLREKGILQQDVFLAADLSENYGYKLIAEEKHTRQRDTILRLCLAARFRLPEVQEALILYGMAPLYGRFARDAVLIAAIGNRVYDLQELNRLLERCGQAPLLPDYE